MQQTCCSLQQVSSTALRHAGAPSPNQQLGSSSIQVDSRDGTQTRACAHCRTFSKCFYKCGWRHNVWLLHVWLRLGIRKWHELWCPIPRRVQELRQQAQEAGNQLASAGAAGGRVGHTPALRSGA
jgi:hypothetical protein